jgi:hypothetical protein
LAENRRTLTAGIDGGAGVPELDIESSLKTLLIVDSFFHGIDKPEIQQHLVIYPMLLPFSARE